MPPENIMFIALFCRSAPWFEPRSG